MGKKKRKETPSFAKFNVDENELTINTHFKFLISIEGINFLCYCLCTLCITKIESSTISSGKMKESSGGGSERPFSCAEPGLTSVQ